MNSKGLAIHAVGSIVGPSQEVWSYNSDGQAITYGYIPAGASAPDEVTNYFYTNGNADSAVYVSGGGSSVTYYEYYKDKLTTIGNENFGLFFFGASSKNLFKSVITHPSMGNDQTYTFQYEFDTQNRITKQMEIEKSGTFVTKYTYY